MSKRASVRHFLLCILACVAGGGGCGLAASEAAQPVELTAEGVPDRRIIDVFSKAQMAIFDAFLDQHPEIRVTRTGGLKLEGDVGESADYLAIAGGTAPDILSLVLRKVPNFIEQGFLLPLDDYFSPEWVNAQQIPPQLWGVVRPDGHLYGVIQDYYIMSLAFRKDLFREAGLPLRAPRDWDELYTFAQRLTFPDKQVAGSPVQRGQWGFQLLSGGWGGWTFTNFVWQAGGEMARPYRLCPQCQQRVVSETETPPAVCSRDETDLSHTPVLWQAAFQELPGVMALNFYQKLRWSEWARCPTDGEPVDIKELDYHTGQWILHDVPRCPKDGTVLDVAALRRDNKVITGVVRYDNNDVQAPLLRGEVAITIVEPNQWLFETAKVQGLSPSMLGFASLPAGPGGHRANFMGGTVLGINATIAKEKIPAAVEYLKHFAGEQSRRITAKTYVENGYAQLLNPLWLKNYGYEEYFAAVPPDIVEAYSSLAQYGRVEPTCRNYQHVQTTELAVPIDRVLFAARAEDANPAQLLRDAAESVDHHLFGIVDARQIHLRRGWGTCILILLLAAIGTLAWRKLRHSTIVPTLIPPAPLAKGGTEFPPPLARGAGGIGRRRRGQLVAWLFMLPALLSILVWQYFPLGRGALMAFYDYRLLEGLKGSSFVWIDNFIEALFDPLFWKVFFNTVYYAALTLGLGFLAPFFLALFLAEVPRGKLLFRTLYYLPAVTTGLVIVFLWKQLIFDPSPAGLLNQMLHSVGLPDQSWLKDWRLAMWCVVIPGIWAGVGPGSIIYLAALKCVPTELYETAEMDGANIRQKLRHVVWPTLKPLLIINFIGAFIGAFRAMENIFAMTAGGPANSTRTLGMEIFFNAFLYLRLGYATALAWILGSLLIGFTVYQLRILRQVEFTTAGEK